MPTTLLGNTVYYDPAECRRFIPVIFNVALTSVA